MLYAGAWRALEAEMWALLEHKGLLDGLLQRIVELEQRPRGMTYHGIWGQMREYPGGAVTTRNGVAWIAMQPAHAVEQPGAGGPWKAILKSDEALLRQLLRDECGRDPRRMNEQALTLDQFMEAIRPELEREVDEMILVQPAHARALLMARREQILREYTGAVRIANLEHRNRELEAPLPPRLVE